ncbi:hypothetical protein BJX62DRAFT_217114, partial [Aspergillus germanicus]
MADGLVFCFFVISWCLISLMEYLRWCGEWRAASRRVPYGGWGLHMPGEMIKRRMVGFDIIAYTTLYVLAGRYT